MVGECLGIFSLKSDLSPIIHVGRCLIPPGNVYTDNGVHFTSVNIGAEHNTIYSKACFKKKFDLKIKNESLPFSALGKLMLLG